MTTASTQLRALEGEIAKFDDVGWDLPFTKRLIAIAKELEADRDEAAKACKELDGFWQKSTTEANTLRTENATLKRRLDEAIGGLHVAHERLDRLPQQSDMEDAMWCAISCEEIEHTLTRITEIDKL